ncbi:YcbK family protein [Budvicia aquatica]|uniref:Murein endopeptidase K n=1 Tax=Budvicia aquatica TaxID=82979 RepID=A0A2C6DLZ9_9GAMM|nr:YcbK family protein [Budvicia aquatica]PHI31358.1 DUF882 domain-containing protein [Budvicia aquatica]GKX51873.1 hypothetical protein SOASR029_21820 [Budvicia aquatica]VFS51682.1 Bacterial protein of uncharacterised function (DUF882) [Budvicia aquatica]
MDKIDHHRRKWLTLGGAALSLALVPNVLLAAPKTATTKSQSQSRTRTLLIKNINTNETIKSTYFNGKSYNKTELARLNHIFRDRRTDQVITIDPKLYDKLYYLQKQFGLNKPIELICGYRSVNTNNGMRTQKRGVAKHSYHTLGKAADIRIVGVPLKNLRDAALQLKSGGVGYYPGSNFVHVDTGPVRTW